MPFGPDSLKASHQGGFEGTSGTATLTGGSDPGWAGTTEGGTVVLVVGWGGQPGVTPAGFTLASRAPSGTAPTGIYHRSNVPAGETSWTITCGASAPISWYVEEWAPGTLDPAAPVDVAPSAAGTGTGGTSAASATLPRSTTYDGYLLVAHSGYLSADNAPVTWSGQTGGVEEVADVGTPGAVKSLGMAVSRRFVQQLGEFQSTATANKAVSNWGTAIVLFTAAEAKREPTVSHFWNFPAEMAGLTNLNLGPSQGRYFEAQAGSPVILVGGGLRLTGSTSVENVLSPTMAVSGISGPGHVANIKLRLNSLSGDLVLGTLQDTAGHHTVLRYVAASQKIGVKVGAGTEVLSNATVTTGVDYSIDVRTRGTTTTRTTDWKLDYGSGPVDQVQATASFAGPSALSSLTAQVGWTAASTGQVTYWHVVLSTVAGHYPLTDGWIFPFLKPDTTGTITARTGTTADLRRFTANGGTIAGSFNSADIIAALRDWPPVLGASADGAAIVTASTGTYAIPMETYDPGGSGEVRVVQVLAPLWAASATAATIKVDGHDGSAATALLTEQDPNADNSSTPPWLVRPWRPSGGWTQAKLDAATIDISSADATPDIGLHALAMIAAVRLAEVVPIIGDVAEAAIDPDTSGTIKVTATAPVDQDMTLKWSKGGTPGSETVEAGTTHTEELGAADATQVDYIEVVSANEAPDRP